MKKMVGPSRPTEAQLSSSICSTQENDDDDDDDDYCGPQPVSSSSRGPVVIAGPTRPQEKPIVADVREEWMLTPGEKDPFAPIQEVFGKSRQFQTGKTAKKQAETLAAIKEANNTEEARAEAERTQKILDEYKEKRGASLMDLHTDKKRGLSGGGGGGGVEKKRIGFDRERDLVSQRPMDRKQAQALVETAKLLDSKFEKGSVQRTTF